MTLSTVPQLSRIYRGIPPSPPAGYLDSFDTGVDWKATYWQFMKTPAGSNITHLIQGKEAILRHVADAAGGYSAAMRFLPISDVTNLCVTVLIQKPTGVSNQVAILLVSRSTNLNDYTNNYDIVAYQNGANMQFLAERNVKGVYTQLANFAITETRAIVQIAIIGGTIYFFVPGAADPFASDVWAFPDFTAYVGLGFKGLQGDNSDSAFDNFTILPSKYTLVS